jgi:hypothetical protein
VQNLSAQPKNLYLLPSAEAARLCAFSTSRFSTLFTQDMGMSYPGYTGYHPLETFILQLAKARRMAAWQANSAGF